jgi:hypothetical protein
MFQSTLFGSVDSGPVVDRLHCFRPELKLNIVVAGVYEEGCSPLVARKQRERVKDRASGTETEREREGERERACTPGFFLVPL